jgi:AAA15 family ATPase/GTPase
MSGDYFREGFQALPAHFTFFSRVDCLKKIIIIAGPNGAGKTTFARDFYLQKPIRLGLLMQI